MDPTLAASGFFLLALIVAVMLARWALWKTLIAIPVALLGLGAAVLFWMADTAPQTAAFLWTIVALIVGSTVMGHVVGLLIGLIWRRMSKRGTSGA